MKGFDRLKVKSAVQDSNKLDLSCDHMTTADIGQINVLYASQLMPRDRFNINASFFSRLAPLSKPTYGRFYFRTMGIFVPAFQVADEADAFFMNQSSFEGSVPHIRHITMLDYVDWLISASTAVTIGTGESDNNDGYIIDSLGNRVKTYDFKYIDANGNKAYRVFSSSYYKWVLKNLFACGFSIPSNVDLRTNSNWYGMTGSYKLNALKLLCFAKAYNDWMSQSTRFNTSLLTFFLRNVRHNITHSTYYNAATNCISKTAIDLIFNNIRLCFESGYFTTAWQQPNSPLSNSDTNTNFTATAAGGTGNDVQILNNQASVNFSTTGTISALQLDWLDRVYRYVRRNNYAGSRTPEKVLARFGIKTEDFKSNYAHILSKSSTPIRVGDVTSTAQTNDVDPNLRVDLGDYAGKGIMQCNTKVDYRSKDYGYLFIIGWFTVNPMNAYGFDRDVLRQSPNDFYQPEFDGVGPDAIPNLELFTNPIKPDSDTVDDMSIFGFTERYNSYRFGRDLITGDFRNWHLDADMNCWHSGRLLNQYRAGGIMVAQSSGFVTMEPYDSQYNRIFATTDSDYDHFYLNCQYNVNAIRPILNLNQAPRLGEGDTNISRNGNEVN